MRRFNTIIESANPPGINQLWIDKKKLRYFAEGKWQLLTGGGGSSEPPEISDHDTWVIDGVDTGKPSRGAKGDNGITPYINSSGNWQIGLIDTGVKAAGIDGQDGLTPYINTDKNWWIGTTNTGIKAEGKDGTNGDDGLTPQLRVTDTAVEYSYDGITWTELIPKSDFIVNNEYINNPDEEDITVVGTKLKFNNKSYSPTDFSGLGRVYLRKNLVEGKNVLTQNMINQPNTVYHIQYDYDLNGSTIIPPTGSYLVFDGGRLYNGNIDIQDKTVTIEDEILGNTAKIRYLLPDNKYAGEVELILNDMKGYFSKYNLTADGVTDNSINLKALIADPAFRYFVKNRRTRLVFAPNNSLDQNPSGTYLFKSPINLDSYGYMRELEIILNADLKFDFSEATVPTLAELKASTTNIAPNFNCFNLSNFASLKIRGTGVRDSNPTNLRLCYIDGGADTFTGTYYEGIKSDSGISYYSSFSNGVISASNCGRVELDNFESFNSFHGISVGGNCYVNGLYVHDIKGDNGITVRGNSTYFKGDRGGAVRNCICESCQDLGISIQGRNFLVENCICRNCGNNNDPESESFGVNSSFNAGGGYSCEVKLSDSHTEVPVNITFINCIAEDCYNYGFYTDIAGVQMIDCQVKNITKTWKDSYQALWESDSFRYGPLILRKGTAIMLPSTAVNVNNPLPTFRLSNCHISNVNGLSSIGVVGAEVQFYNCIIDNVKVNDSIVNPPENLCYGCIFKNMNLNQFDYTIIDTATKQFGPTSNRPTAPAKGKYYFDSTLGKPLWWDGTAWVTYPDSGGSTMATLTFTGAVETTYNGSTPVTVNIPTGGGSGTSDYNDLTNKPKIGDIELSGTKTLAELGIQPAGSYATETYVTEQITAAIGTINTALDNINGEVI